MNLDALFEDLLTSGVPLADPQTIRKLRVLNTVHLAVIMGAPLVGLFYFYIGAVILFYVSIMVGLLMVTSLLLLRKTKNIILIGNYAVSILWVLIFFISWNTGGITYEGVLNSSWILKGCLILLAVFLSGYLWGTIWTVVGFFEIGLDRLSLPDSLPIPKCDSLRGCGPLPSRHVHAGFPGPGSPGLSFRKRQRRSPCQGASQDPGFSRIQESHRRYS
jgi:hypothetical protein